MKIFIFLFVFVSILLGSSCKPKESQPVATAETKGVIDLDSLKERIKKTSKLSDQAKSKINTYLDGKNKRSVGVMEWVEFAQNYAKDNGYSNSISAFELGTELFPKSTVAFYFLADAHVENKDTINALKYFDLAAKLDQRNTCATDVSAFLQNPVDTTFSRVCAPCYCNQHKYRFKNARFCIQCGMELVKDSTRIAI